MEVAVTLGAAEGVEVACGVPVERVADEVGAGAVISLIGDQFVMVAGRSQAAIRIVRQRNKTSFFMAFIVIQPQKTMSLTRRCLVRCDQIVR